MEKNFKTFPSASDLMPNHQQNPLKKLGGGDFSFARIVSVKPILEQTMSKAKKILITTATSEIYIVRGKGDDEAGAFCLNCEAETEMLTLDQAVDRSGLTALEILRRAQEGELHFRETANGHLLFCQSSLNNFLCKE